MDWSADKLSAVTKNPLPLGMGSVKLNQVILVINNVVLDFTWMIAIPESISIIGNILDVIGFVGMTSVVVCVESRLDAYRLDREAAGWTEEKGYPEGYVHEYEKKGNK